METILIDNSWKKINNSWKSICKYACVCSSAKIGKIQDSFSERISNLQINKESNIL